MKSEFCKINPSKTSKECILKHLDEWVRTILRMDDVAQTVHAYWNTDSNNSNNSADSNDEDSLVSVIS